MSKKRRIFITLTSYFVILIISCVVLLRFVTTIKLGDIAMSPNYDKDDVLLINKTVKTINREDVVVVSIINDDTTTYVVKRVIGLPGETIYLGENDHIYINDELYEDPNAFIEEGYGYAEGISYQLKENEYFVVGDNRHHSIDSRSNGPILKENIVGKVIKTIYPFKKLFSK